MACETILQNELHEKYVLNQLENPEKEEFELHIKTCKACQAELETQRLMIAGIQEAGRKELKNEIKRQAEISKSNHPGITWGQVSKIAAVLLIFVLTPSVIIYLSKSNPELVPAVGQKVENAPADVSRSTVDAASQGELETTQAELKQEVDLETFKTSRQTEAKVVNQAEENETPKKNISKPAPDQSQKILKKEGLETSIRSELFQSKIALDENAETVKAETKEIRLKSKPATPADSQPLRQIDPNRIDVVNESDARKFAFSSRSGGRRTYVYEAPAARQKKSGQSTGRIMTMKKRQDQTIADLRFISDAYAVLVHLKNAAYKKAGGDLETDLDQYVKLFEVEIIKRDSLNLEMNWLVASDFLDTKPEEIKLEIFAEEIMHATIGEQIYEIALGKKSTKARLVK